MIRLTSLAPWKFKFPLTSSLTSTFLKVGNAFLHERGTPVGLPADAEGDVEDHETEHEEQDKPRVVEPAQISSIQTRCNLLFEPYFGGILFSNRTHSSIETTFRTNLLFKLHANFRDQMSSISGSVPRVGISADPKLSQVDMLGVRVRARQSGALKQIATDLEIGSLTP